MKRFLIFLNLFFIFTSFLLLQKQDKKDQPAVAESKPQTATITPKPNTALAPVDNKKENSKINPADSLFLLQFFKQMGGKNWYVKWVSTHPIERWRGVVVKNDKIIELRLPKNNLVGQIPDGIKQLKNLKVLDLSGNIVGGELPEGLFELASLTHLDLSKKFEVDKKGRVIRPKIDSVVAPVIAVDSLSVKAKKLPYSVLVRGITGSVSPKIGKLTKLEYLDLSGHALEGAFPLVVGCKKMKKLLLSGNQFTDLIPSEIYKMQNLIRLDLSYNAFLGSIPPEIVTIKSLDYVNLSYNKLTGLIPGLKGIELSHILLEGNHFDNTLAEAKRVVQKNLPPAPKKEIEEHMAEELIEESSQELHDHQAQEQQEIPQTPEKEQESKLENQDQIQVLPEKTAERIFETEEIK